MRELLTQTWQDDSAQDLTEYALIAALVSTFTIVAIKNAGTSVSQLWSRIASAIPQ